MSEPIQTIEQAIRFGKKLLQQSENPSDSPKLDSELLLLKVINDHSEKCDLRNKTWLMTWPEKLLLPIQLQQFQELLQQRSQGQPIAYLLGQQDFWTLSLKVTSDTLIPRPETELLVEHALEIIDKQKSQHILDLGTGSGAIALAIAQERPTSKIIATDISHNALKVAQENAQTAGINNVQFQLSHWFTDIEQQKFDLILSNPPYIDSNDPELEANVRHYEPLSALIAEKSGLADIEQIIQNSIYYLQHNAWLLIEHGYQQSEAVQNLLQQQNFKNIQTIKDLNHLPRLSLGQLSLG